MVVSSLGCLYSWLSLLLVVSTLGCLYSWLSPLWCIIEYFHSPESNFTIEWHFSFITFNIIKCFSFAFFCFLFLVLFTQFHLLRFHDDVDTSFNEIRFAEPRLTFSFNLIITDFVLFLFHFFLFFIFFFLHQHLLESSSSSWIIIFFLNHHLESWST